MHTKDKGLVSELAVAKALTESGYTVLMPLGDNCRYDLVIDDNGKFYRVQVKTGMLKYNSSEQPSVIVFPTSSSKNHTTNKHRDSYIGEIDYFGVYCPQNNGLYLVPISDVPDKECTLRLLKSLNKQVDKIRWAKNYEIKPHTGQIA